MKHNKIASLGLLFLTISLILGLAACKPSSPVTETGPSISASPSAAVTATTNPAPSPSAISTPAASPSPSLSPTPSPTISPSPAPSRASEFYITANNTTQDFPNSVTFTVQGTSALASKNITLEYCPDKRSIAEETTRVQVTFEPGTKINASYTWAMKKTGSLPPGAGVWYQWKITDDANNSYTTPRQTTTFADTRFTWEVEKEPDMDIYWHDQDSDTISDLVSEVNDRLSRVELNVSLPPDRKIKVFIYQDSEELRGAGLFLHEWTGAFTVPDYNTIITYLNKNILEQSERTLAHETTHLYVNEAVFGPFGDIPLWLNEGLAQYSEGEMDDYHKTILNEAIQDHKLLSVRSLGSSFPTDTYQAILAYTESQSFVAYLVKTHGWEKIRDLLAVFKDGSTFDKALIKIYGTDTNALDKEWRAHIGANYP